MKQGKQKPKFQPGQTVLVTTDGKEKIITGEPKWNGFTFMYEFENTDLRCGEMYLRPIINESIKKS